MRNLKRALSLALASVMLLGMMVVGAGATSFPDVDDSNNVEAIEVLEAVKVFVGDENGKLNPDENISRNEMAVILAKLLKGSDADSYTVGSFPFTDVPEWAQKYVACCYDNGIVAGRGDGIYDGDSTVNGQEAAAMVLRILGYTGLEGTGANWAQPVVAKANSIGLFDGVASSATAPLIRDQVAQLALNALEATMVEPDSAASSITTPEGFTMTTGVKFVERLAGESSSYKNAISDNTKDDKATLELGEYLYKGDLKKEADDKDAFGRPATSWTYKNAEVCTVETSADASFSGRFTYKELANALGSSLVKNLSDPSKVDIEYYVDGVSGAGGLYHNGKLSGSVHSLITNGQYDYNLANYLDGDKNKTDSHLGERGMQVDVYVTEGEDESEKDTVTVVMVNTYLAQASGDYNASSKELRIDPYVIPLTSANSKLSLEDFPSIVNYADEDYLLITVSDSDEDGKYEVQTIAPAEAITGNVDKYTDGSNVTLDGDTYNYSKNFYNLIDASIIKAGAIYTVDEDATIILDKDGFIIGLAEAEGSDNYVYVAAIKNGDSGFGTDWIGDAYFTDGTNETISVDKVDGKKPEREDTGYWYTYTVTSNDKYRLTQSPNNVGGDDSYTADEGTTLIGNGSVTITYYYEGSPATISGTNSTVFIIKDENDDVDVYTGIKNVPDVKTNSGGDDADTVVAAVKDGSYATYVFVDVNSGSTSGGGAASGDIIFVYDTDVDKKGGSNGTYYTFKSIILNGEDATTVDADSTGVFGEGVGLYNKVKYDSDDLVISATQVKDDDKDDGYRVFDVEGATVTQKGGTITLGARTLTLADGVVIWLIDDGDADEVSAAQLAKDYDSENLTATVWASVKGGDATVIYVVVTGGYSEETDADGAKDLLSAYDEATVKDLNAEGGLTVEDGKTLTITGTANGTITTDGDGKVVLSGATAGAGLTLGDDSNVTGTIDVSTGGELVIGKINTAPSVNSREESSEKLVVTAKDPDAKIKVDYQALGVKITFEEDYQEVPVTITTSGTKNNINWTSRTALNTALRNMFPNGAWVNVDDVAKKGEFYDASWEMIGLVMPDEGDFLVALCDAEDLENPIALSWKVTSGSYSETPGVVAVSQTMGGTWDWINEAYDRDDMLEPGTYVFAVYNPVDNMAEEPSLANADDAVSLIETVDEATGGAAFSGSFTVE